MKFKRVLCAVLVLFLVDTAFPKEPEWLKKMKQITLLSDTHSDVISKLGMPSNGSLQKKLSEHFDFDDGRLRIEFASGMCVATSYSDGKPIGWKVPEWTVIEVSFTPDKLITPKDLGIKFKDFTAKPLTDVPEGIEYISDELGIEYVLNEGRVEDITFRPAKKYDYLRCK